MFMGRIEAGGREGRVGNDTALSRSLPTLLGMMIAEILDSASEDQWAGFFHSIGARLAAELDLEGIEDAEDLVDAMNGLWAALGWGMATLDLDDEGVDIQHHDLPATLGPDDEGGWAKVAPHILVGAYESWFRSLGSGPNLRTQILRQSPNLVQLRHGF